MDSRATTDQEIVNILADRLKQYRLNANLTQTNLAKKAGIHIQTVKNLENGKPPSLLTFIQVMRALDLLNNLEHFLPDIGISPIELLKLKGKERERASGKSNNNHEDLPIW